MDSLDLPKLQTWEFFLLLCTLINLHYLLIVVATLLHFFYFEVSTMFPSPHKETVCVMQCD